MQGRVVLVSTDLAIRRIIPTVLSQTGYHVDLLSPMEALGFVCQHEADVVILDLGPDQAACFVRLAGRLKWRGPTIILSAGTRADLEMAELSADSFLRKPIDPEEIVTALGELTSAAAAGG